jgi:hypothetical protein
MLVKVPIAAFIQGNSSSAPSILQGQIYDALSRTARTERLCDELSRNRKSEFQSRRKKGSFNPLARNSELIGRLQPRDCFDTGSEHTVRLLGSHAREYGQSKGHACLYRQVKILKQAVGWRRSRVSRRSHPDFSDFALRSRVVHSSWDSRGPSPSGTPATAATPWPPA